MADNIAGVDWLGHNGISVSTNMPVETHGIDSMLRLSSSGRVVIFGLVSLFDELRPDVSVSRDKLLGLPFNIRSALHLAIRRAASCYLDSPERGFAASVMRHEVLTRMGLGELTSAQVEADPLISQWRGEQIVPLDQETMCSIDELRSLAKSGPVNLKLPVQVWSHKIVDDVFSGNSSFYRTLLLALAELELDLELARLAGPAELPDTFPIMRSPSVVPPVRFVRPDSLCCPRSLSCLIARRKYLSRHPARPICGIPSGPGSPTAPRC